MKQDRVVAINFCGGCNPVIARGDIARAIAAALAERGIAVVTNDWQAAFVVRLSGCTAGCVERYQPCDPPGVAIAGRTFSGFAVDDTRLAELAIAAAEKHFGQPAPSRRYGEAQ